MRIEKAPPTLYDEIFDEEHRARPHCRGLEQWLEQADEALLAEKRREADVLFRRLGVTFNVYGEDEGIDRLIPFDLIPRVLSAADWQRLQVGLRQRVNALNRFLHDIYHDYEIIRAGVIPAEQVFANPQYQQGMQNLKVPRNIYAHIAGIDLIRHNDGEFYVLEDNLRCPSGVSYILENRRMMMRLFPELFARMPVAPVDHYPALLGETLKTASLQTNPTVVLLTPGRFNSAYFEHAFLANAMGNGVADDKSIYPFVPEMIRFYLGEEPVLRNVPTWQCRLEQDLKYVLDNLEQLVVKEAQGAGGYGMLIGPSASRAELDNFRAALKARPEHYIAQPTLSLSSSPTFVGNGIAPRHLDLGPLCSLARKCRWSPAD